MKMKKIVCALCLATLIPVSSTASATTVADEPQQEKQAPAKEIPNPEKAARKRTDEMDKVLNLTEKQYKKIYKLNLKEEREKLEVLIGRGDKGAGRPPMMGGGRPPMMNGGGEPPMMNCDGQPPMMGRGGRPMMAPPADREEKKKEMEERAEKRMKKIRKILTDEQYDLWLTMKPEQPAPRPMPKADKPAPGEEVPPFDMMQNEATEEE